MKKTRSKMAGDKRKKLLKLIILLVVIIPILLFYTSGLRFYEVPDDGGSSMIPTLSPGDIVLVKTGVSPSEISRGTIVLIKHIVGPDTIKTFERVIAYANDQIEYKGENTYLNGNLLIEPYVYYSSQATLDKYSVHHKNGNVEPEVLPPNKYFVMGDNRNQSFDSRDPEFGLVDYSEILGIPSLILWSDTNGKILSSPK